jgi:hypothetical protein
MWRWQLDVAGSAYETGPRLAEMLAPSGDGRSAIDLVHAARTPPATQIPHRRARHTWNQGSKISGGRE